MTSSAARPGITQDKSRFHHAATRAVTAAGFGAGREIKRIVSVVATQSAPATKKAGR
jgi:hypothetical protein